MILIVVKTLYIILLQTSVKANNALTTPRPRGHGLPIIGHVVLKKRHVQMISGLNGY
jgi:hypothetical protein